MPQDWTFEKALTEAEKKVCPQFNNASENLLSGWSLNDENKVEVKNKQIGRLIISNFILILQSTLF